MYEKITEMDMNTIIIVCAVIWTAAAVACMCGRSQMMRRLGCMELVMTAAVGGSALFGYRKAADFTTEQYHQMLAISLGSVIPYLADLEDELEVYGGSEEAFLREAGRVVEDALPILQSGEARYTFGSLFLVKKDEQGVYGDCFSAGEAQEDWESLQAEAAPLIRRALRNRGTAWREYDGETALLAAADQSRIAPAYALVVTVSQKPLLDALSAWKTQYFFGSLFFLAAATLLVVFVVLMQEKDIHRILRLLARAAKGREEAASLLKLAGKPSTHKESSETRALHSSLHQIAINTERTDYLKYQVLQAYYRFVPRELEKMLGKKSILDVAPMDRAETESTVAFVSFAEKNGLSTEEYLRQMQRNYALLCEGRREFGGTIVTGGSDPGLMLLLFCNESRQALRFGIKMTVGRMADKEAGQAFVLLHRTSLVYGVAGDEEQFFPYLYSEEIRILQKYTDCLRAMGVRMAVTGHVWEAEREGILSRYIGYIEEGQSRFPLYEILDAYPAKERDRRAVSTPRFQQALDLYYRSDFYLARNLFADILRNCPADEVAKWYLFLCEDGLNREKTKRHSFGLFSGK